MQLQMRKHARAGSFAYTAGRIWDERTYARLLKIVKDIEIKYGVGLPRAADGALWIGHAAAMPSGWGRDAWYRLAHDRLIGMTLLCNKRWISEYSSCSTQSFILTKLSLRATRPSSARTYTKAARMTSKYREFPGLPLTVWIRHPRRLAVAHRIHGR